jgi:two-component system, chemotaxis family, sensor kinase CheA
MAAAIDGMQDIIKEFLVESAESVDVLERDLVALEHEPGSRELLAQIFRAVHTLKGNSAALGYPKLESVAHAGENLLSRLRDGELALTAEIANELLAMVDALRGLLRAIEQGGRERDGDCNSVVSSLKRLSGTSPAANQGDEKVRGASLPSAEADSFLKATALDAGLKARTTRATFSSATCKVQPENLRSAAEAVPLQKATSTGSIRVPVGVLDRMMSLVGELVLARNQVLHSVSGCPDADLATAAQRLKWATCGLQESVMKARVQPLGTLWNQLPRLVRDMAGQCGKQIVIDMEGSEIELDRTILESIKDPVTHILRNAIDHGIESPAKRTQAGKSATGHIRLRAWQEGGRVHVEISDDGAGIDLPRVRQRAVERGLITAEQAATMSERQLASLVFTAGFSTTDTVTNISGRGVGLDVVRTNIEGIGGGVDLQGVSGEGTTLKINLPLTLAILPALIVSCGGERFAIAQANLIELIRMELEHGGMPIEQVCGAPVYRLRDRLLPLAFLDRALHLPRQNARAPHIVVLQGGARQFGLVVDGIGDSEEIVVKPLSKHLKQLRCFAGAAVLGDGHIVLILDVVGVAQLANLSTGLPSESRKELTASAASPVPAQHSWVTFRGTTGTRLALPMAAVARLEEIPAEMIERLHGREVVQYRGEILPLLRVSKLFHEPAVERDPLQVLVLREAGGSMGLVVDRIEDIVEETVELRSGAQSGLMHEPVVIDGRVADVLGVKHVLALAGGPVSPAVAPGSR